MTLIDGECRSPCSDRAGETANLCIAYGSDPNAVSVGGCAAYPSSITDQCSTGLTCGVWTLDGNQAPSNPAYSEVVSSPTCCAAGACWSASQQMCIPCTGEEGDVSYITETTQEATAHGWIYRTLNRKYGVDVEDKVTFRFLTPKSNTSVSWPTIRTDAITYCLDNNNPAYCQNRSPTVVPNCSKTGSECLEGAETRIVNGESIYRECWKYQDSFQCILPDMENDCQELRDRGCTQTGSTCAEEHNGSCILYEQNYRCERTPGQSSTTTQCGSQSFCLSGNCTNFNHTATPGDEFSRTVALMEAQREAGTYLNQNSMTMFNGSDNRCSKKLGGLGNCCKTNTQGGQSNNVLAQAVTSNALNNAGGYLVNSSKWVGSTYAYDSLFSSDAPDWMVQGFEGMFGSGMSWGSFNPSIGFMGVTATFGGAVPAGATTLVSGPSMTVYFNPATFYFAIAMMVIQEILSCDQDEQVLAMKRGSNLCHQVGSYCSSKFFGVCQETKESYCCYNSRLARMINEQGRVQLNRGWGDAKSPNCTGLTADELSGLDFSSMNLDEFYAEIAPNVPDADGVKSRAGGYDLSPLRDRVPDYFTR